MVRRFSSGGAQRSQTTKSSCNRRAYVHFECRPRVEEQWTSFPIDMEIRRVFSASLREKRLASTLSFSSSQCASRTCFVFRILRHARADISGPGCGKAGTATKCVHLAGPNSFRLSCPDVVGVLTRCKQYTDCSRLERCRTSTNSSRGFFLPCCFCCHCGQRGFIFLRSRLLCLEFSLGFPLLAFEVVHLLLHVRRKQGLHAKQEGECGAYNSRIVVRPSSHGPACR